MSGNGAHLDDSSPLDSLRPSLPRPPGRVRRALHRAGVVALWAVGYRRVPHLDTSLQTVFPWSLSLAIAIPLAVLFAGAVQVALAGACGGLVLGGVLAWGQQRGSKRRATTRLINREAELLRYAEDRATSVVRQFSWSVDDLLEARRAVRDRDAKLELVAKELMVLRMVVEQRDRDLAEAAQKMYEVGLFDVDRERSRASELEGAVAEARTDLERARADSAQLRSDAATAARRITSLEAALRRIKEVTSRAERRATDHGTIEFSWKLEFDGREDLLRMKLTDPHLSATSVRILRGEAVIARQSEAASGDASLDHDRTVGWQILAIDGAIVERFRRGVHDDLRFEFLVDGEWLSAAPETPKVGAVPEARIWSLEGRRAARKAAV